MLEGKRIQLRDLKESDLDFLYKIENNDQSLKYDIQNKYLSKSVLFQYIKERNLDINIDSQFRFIIDFQNHPIGIVDLYDYNKTSAGVGIIIQENFRRKGYAKESLLLLLKYCFNDLKLTELFCSIANDNLNSIKLFSSIGFKEKSKLKEIIYFNIKA